MIILIHPLPRKYPHFAQYLSIIACSGKAKNGELWSQQRAITFVGNVDNVLDEVEQIKEEQAEKQQNEISKQEQLSKFNSRDMNK